MFMKKCTIGSCFLLVSILLLIISCEQKKTDDLKSVKILINGGSGEVTLSILNTLTLENSMLAETTIDTTGNGVLQVELSRPVFTFLKIGEKYGRVYLAPGYNLQVSLNDLSSKSELHYEGIGAEPNNYLEKIFLMQQNFESAGGGIFDLKPVKFINQVDSLENVFENFHRNYVDSVAMANDVSDLLKKKNEFYLISLRQQYGTMLYGNKINDTDVDNSFKNLIANLPLDSTYLKIRLYEYARLLDMYIDQNFYEPFVTDTFAESSYPKDYFLKNADKTIKRMITHQR